MKKIALLLLFGVLGGCSFLQGVSTASTTPITPVTQAAATNTVFALKSGYAVALVGMIQYAKLPNCANVPAVPLCSSNTVLSKMEQYRAKASDAINKAEVAVQGLTPDTTVLSAAIAAAKTAYADLSLIVANPNSGV